MLVLQKFLKRGVRPEACYLKNDKSNTAQTIAVYVDLQWEKLRFWAGPVASVECACPLLMFVIFQVIF